MRQPLKRLLVIVVKPLSRGCMQVANREYSNTGREASSASLRSTSQTSFRRFSGSACADRNYTGYCDGETDQLIDRQSAPHT